MNDLDLHIEYISKPQLKKDAEEARGRLFCILHRNGLDDGDIEAFFELKEGKATRIREKWISKHGARLDLLSRIRAAVNAATHPTGARPNFEKIAAAFGVAVEDVYSATA